jgi:AcrR family transcriptional regulator
MPPPKRRPPARDAATEAAQAEKRIARRDRRRDRSREEILEAARRVLVKKGVGAMTIEAVAKEVGVTKTALYYYYPSKDALLFELMFGVLKGHAQAVHEAVDEARDGADALGILIRKSVTEFAPRLEDFRLAFLHGQVASPGSVHFDEEQFARIRPLNDLWLAGAAGKLVEDRDKRHTRAPVEPRLMAFLAYLAALGMLTMKGMVESLDDPLLYSDDQMIEGFAQIFAAAAEPAKPEKATWPYRSISSPRDRDEG